MNHDKVYSLYRSAIRAGILIRPDTCSRCGERPGYGRDGRSLIQGHHHDYSKPLDVEWICAKCHRVETPLPENPGAPTPGERNGWSKLTENNVREIRKLRSEGHSYYAMAKVFGVNETTIRRVALGFIWSHVKDENEERAALAAKEAK